MEPAGELLEREGRYFPRRWEQGYGGKQANLIEREIHHVMGSGHHARTYVHRTPQGRFAELPHGIPKRVAFWR